MNRVIVKGFISLAAALLGTICLWHSTGAAGREGAPQAAAGERHARAREVFDQRCARCHGRDGRGQTRLGDLLDMPDFTDDEWWRREGPGDARMKASISQGKGEMPAFGKKLSRSEIAALAAYVRDFAPAAESDSRR